MNSSLIPEEAEQPDNAATEKIGGSQLALLSSHVAELSQADAGEPATEVSAGRFHALQVLKLADFRYLFISTSLLVFAFQMRPAAESWLALELTDSQFWVSAVSGLPAVVVHVPEATASAIALVHAVFRSGAR